MLAMSSAIRNAVSPRSNLIGASCSLTGDLISSAGANAPSGIATVPKTSPMPRRATACGVTVGSRSVRTSGLMTWPGLSSRTKSTTWSAVNNVPQPSMWNAVPSPCREPSRLRLKTGKIARLRENGSCTSKMLCAWLALYVNCLTRSSARGVGKRTIGSKVGKFVFLHIRGAHKYPMRPQSNHNSGISGFIEMFRKSPLANPTDSTSWQPGFSAALPVAR